MKKNIQQVLIGTLFLMLTFATAQANNTTSTYYDADKESHIAVRQLRGDMNGDGDRTVVDVTILINYILTHKADFELWIGDLDGNEDITVVDVTILVNIILGADYNDPDNPDLHLDDLKGDDPATGL